MVFTQPLKRLTFTSKYSQRLRQISCKIFNQYYVPEITKKEYYEPDRTNVDRWAGQWHSEETTFKRLQLKPADLQAIKNINYYPAHPQIRQFSHVLREYGLYRDEHRDYIEETRRIKQLKGKKVVVRLYGDQRTKEKSKKKK